MRIIKLNAKDWQKYKDIRIEALESEPLAYAKTPKESLAEPDCYWRERLELSENISGNSKYFVEVDSKIVGMADVVIENKKEKIKHIANIYGVYISKPYRGRGYGKKLLKTVLKEIEKRKEIRKVKIGVNPIQKAALTLYKSLGFKEVGTFKDELKVDGKYYDEIVLEKFLIRK